jgi:hypothetical protein
MSRFGYALNLLLLLAALAVVGCAGHDATDSNLTVRMTGDAQIYGVYNANRNFTGRR